MSVPEFIIRAVDSFYIAPLARIVPRQTFRYGVCGAATYFVFDPVLYFAVYHYVVAERAVSAFGMTVSPEMAALALVFPVTFFVGFWLNRNVAFRFSPLATRTQLARYALSVAGSLAMNCVLMKLFVSLLGLWPTPSKVLTSVLCTVYSYLAAKYFTFRNARAE